VSEEPDGNGTLSLCSQGWLGDAAINLEATDNHVAVGHRGIIGLRYSFEQAARHASIRGNQENVIVKAGRLASALDQSLDGWADPSDAFYGPPTLNIGHISGGSDIFTTPHHVMMDVGIRYAPGTFDHVVSYVGAAINDDITSAIFEHFDAAHVPPDGDLARTFLACANEADTDRRLVAFPAGCDARHFVNRYHTPTLIFGPGRLEQAHGINEYMDLAQWQRASEILALFITRWCV
jgi:acetylornithine deacetylase